MYTPLKMTTDYSLLHSLIKIPDLITFLNDAKIKSCAIVDTNLYGVLDFYHSCRKNGIKPIVGLEVTVNNLVVYLYAKNYDGYQNLLKIHTIIHERELSIYDLEKYKRDVLVIIPFKSMELRMSLAFYDDIYFGYQNEAEKVNLSIIGDNIVFVQDVRVLRPADLEYMQYIDMIAERDKQDYSNNVFIRNKEFIDEEKIAEVVSKLNLDIPFNNRYIPKYKEDVDSSMFLQALAFKGLEKRLKGKVTDEYKKRLEYELSVIKKMGFVDYFLIVYDYVLFAKKNNIMVGPGRGSAAGALVSYVLGIIDVDPLKYNLMFERFLNPERVTMPDIDIDFDAHKRDMVIDYIKDKYGHDKVAGGITFNTLKARSVLITIGKLMNINSELFNRFMMTIDRNKDLRGNLANETVKKYLHNYQELKDLYRISLKLENIKKNVSKHAAGLVICSTPLDEVIPIYVNGEEVLTGVAMEFLEDMGLLKMDLLSSDDIGFIGKCLEVIGYDKLKNIDLEDEEVFAIFNKQDVDGIFQFRTPVMRNVLSKLKIDAFDTIVDAVALVRPGPRDYLNAYVENKKNPQRIKYLHPDLEPILKSTYGILIYQEQIMAILQKMGGFSLSEADLIRRAISKKKEENIKREKERFVKRAVERGYKEEVAMAVYEQISKFASFGFNKSHSVAYALVAYQMAYLKAHYRSDFMMVNLLNDKSSNIEKQISYMKRYNINVIKPSVINRNLNFELIDNRLVLPLSSIKGINDEVMQRIVEVNELGFCDFFEFVCKTKKFLNKELLEILIRAGALDFLEVNHQTLVNNITSALNYADLVDDDFSLVKKPALVEFAEYSAEVLREDELNYYGFYVSNHPCSKYITKDYMKIKDMVGFAFKRVKCVILINKIKTIKTKKNEDMAFLLASDETGSCDVTVFPNRFSLLKEIKENDVVMVWGEVTKRFDKYQIVVGDLKKVE